MDQIISIVTTQTIEPSGQMRFSELKKMAHELLNQHRENEDEADCVREEKDEEPSIAYMYMTDVLERCSIPFERYFLRTPENLNSPEPRQLLPLEVPEKAPFGVIVAMNSELYVVVEDATPDGMFMCLTPVRYIDITK